MKNIFFHVDVNSAYLSWEAAYRRYYLGDRKDLRFQKAAVGGDIAKRHGIILAKSMAAGACGVRTGDSILEARRKCPELMIVPPDYELYECSSAMLVKLLKQYSPRVEQYSIDEAFMEMTGTENLWGPPEKAAAALKDRIREELGFTVNIGISENRLLAKMAGDFKKPDLVHTLFFREVPQKMWPLPVEKLFFVGRAAGGKLRSLGIHTIGELAAADPELLRSHLKKQGEWIQDFANGKDCSPVLEPPVKQAGYGNSTTTAEDVTDPEAAGRVLLYLSEKVGARLRADGAKAAVVSVSIRDQNFRNISRQRTLKRETDITGEIYQISRGIFEQMWDGRPLRHLGIHTAAGSEEGGWQLELFPGEEEKKRRMDQTVDCIRRRFGPDALVRASLMSRAGGR